MRHKRSWLLGLMSGVILMTALPARADSLSDGIAAFAQGDDVTAERLLKDASADRPLDPQPYDWLAKLYERTIQPQACQAAMAQASRLRQAAQRRAQANTPAPAPKTVSHSRIELNAGTLPKAELAEVDEVLRLVDTGPTLQAGPAPRTPDEKRARLQQLQTLLQRMKGALGQLQEHAGAYGQTPQKVTAMVDKLQGQIQAQAKTVKDLKGELGETGDD